MGPLLATNCSTMILIVTWSVWTLIWEIITGCIYNIQGLTPSTRYIIAVAAVNDGGTGPYSDPPLTVWTLSDTGTGDELKCVAILKNIFTTKSAATTSTFICRYYWPYWN